MFTGNSQTLQQLGIGRRRIGAEVLTLGDTLALDQQQRLGIAQAGKPGMPGGGVKQGSIAAHVGVVTQARAGALRLSDPGLTVAFDHP
ncbi:hypothetical protein D3C84_1057070 [compost metagenome]